MEKWIYWIRKCFVKRHRFCRGFCVTCHYYEVCRNDCSFEEAGTAFISDRSGN